MNVAIVIYHFTSWGGGVERIAYQHVKELINRGHDVRIYAHRFEATDLNGKFTKREVPVTKVYSPLKHLTFAANVKKALKNEDADVVHSFSRTYSQDVYRIGGGTHREYLRSMEEGADSPIRRAARWISSRLNPKERAILRLEKKTFAEGSYRVVTAVSHRTKEEIIRHYAVPADKIRVIHNGVNLRTFHPALRPACGRGIRKMFGFEGKDLLLLFCGSGFQRKGLGGAIQAVAKLPPSMRVRLLVVGKGKAAEYRRLVRRLKVKERVFFLGERDRIQEFYAASDLLILPTFYDPFPNVCLEAMASGTPVVTTEVAGVAEIITHGKDSFVVRDGNAVEAIADCILKAVDPAVWPSLSAGARATAERHSIAHCVDENENVYKEVVRMKRGGA